MNEPIASATACSQWFCHSSYNCYSCVVWLLLLVELSVLAFVLRSAVTLDVALVCSREQMRPTSGVIAYLSTNASIALVNTSLAAHHF